MRPHPGGDVDLGGICEEHEEGRHRAASWRCWRPRPWLHAATRPRRTPAASSGSEAASDFLPCIVSDAGGFDDKSFNQLGFEGATAGRRRAGRRAQVDVESNSENDYAPNLESLVAEGCDAIVTVGFALSAATVESAKANPDINYILIDDAADNDFDGEKDAENIKPLLYNTAEAAFLAGYAAADYTKTGIVGTYGGQPFPTVTIFMDGFKQGAEYYAEEKGKDVKVVGFEGGEKGSFTGGFEANEAATSTARRILDQGADVILPVGGPIYQGALDRDRRLRRGRRAGRRRRRLLRDRPQHPGRRHDLDPQGHEGLDLRGHHVRRQRRVRPRDLRRHPRERRRRPGAVPQLRGQGVRLAPGELDEVKAGIIDGSIEVKSYLDQ